MFLYFTALVWFVNGLYCKILGQVPRHQLIVDQILGSDFGSILTILIGCSEVIMAIWILTKYKRKLNAYLQITIVLTMNVIEFIFASDLLLWGKLNSLWAILFLIIVYLTEKHKP